MNYDEIKKGKKYVIYEEWRDIKDDEYAKYVEVTHNPQKWPHDWVKIKWLDSDKIEYLSPTFFEREANREKDKDYLMVLAL